MKSGGAWKTRSCWRHCVSPGQARQRQVCGGPGRRRAPRKPGGRQVDYGLLQEENSRRGRLGEQLVVAFEQRQLREAGHPDLADRVRWVARDDGDGLGYDVLSFTADGGERHIEVKTTALAAQTPFYISSAELEFARRHPRSFALYRVYDVLDRPCFYVLEGDIAASVTLTPVTYRAELNDTPVTSPPTQLPGVPGSPAAVRD